MSGGQADRERAKPWTAQQDQVLRAAVAKGLTHAQIAVAMERTPAAICQRVSRLAQAAAEPSKRERWTPEEDEVLRAGRAAGVTYKVLAARLGRTLAATKSRAEVVVTEAPRPPVERPARVDQRINKCSQEGQSLRVLQAQQVADREAAAARIRARRAANAARVQAAYEAQQAAVWQPSLSAEQLRDAMAKAKRARSLAQRGAGPDGG